MQLQTQLYARWIAAIAPTFTLHMISCVTVSYIYFIFALIATILGCKVIVFSERLVHVRPLHLRKRMKLSGEGHNIASVLCPIPFHVNEIKYV